MEETKGLGQGNIKVTARIVLFFTVGLPLIGHMEL